MKYLMIFLSMFPSLGMTSKRPNCPPVEWIQQTTFIEAIQNAHDATQWNVVSDYLWVNDRYWQVEYGAFFPRANDQQTALQLAQAAYATDSKSILSAYAVSIPNYWLCDYIGNGRAFWVTAVTHHN